MPDLYNLFAKMAREVGSRNSFDLLDLLLAEMNLMALAGQLGMAAEMMATSQSLFNELAILPLLHPNPDVRSQLPGIFLEVGGDKHITPLSLRRLIGLRNWLLQEERSAMDRLIREVRRANIASAPLLQAQLATAYASPFDGSGAQGVWMTNKVKKDHHALGVLVKQQKGIIDTWQRQGFTKTDIADMVKDMHRSGGTERVEIAFFRRLVAHFIAVGLRNHASPPAHLLVVDERLGGDYWKPQWVSPVEEIERLLWMALLAQASQPRKPLPWQEFLIPARETSVRHAVRRITFDAGDCDTFRAVRVPASASAVAHRPVQKPSGLGRNKLGLMTAI